MEYFQTCCKGIGSKVSESNALHTVEMHLKTCHHVRFQISPSHTVPCELDSVGSAHWVSWRLSGQPLLCRAMLGDPSLCNSVRCHCMQLLNGYSDRPTSLHAQASQLSRSCWRSFKQGLDMPKERLSLRISLMPMQKHSGNCNAAMIQDSVH